MTEHLSTEIVERFHQQALAAGDRTVIYNHLLKCEACRRQVVDPGIEALALEALSENLVSESDHQNHPDFETIERYVDQRLNKVDQHEIDKHLDVCPECSSEVTDLRESLATMSPASVRQHEKGVSFRDRIRSFIRLPAFPSPLRLSALVALLLFAVIAAVVVWRLKSGGFVQVPAGGRDLNAGSNPTPSQSPLNIQPGSTPLPTPGPSRHNRFEPTPWKRHAEPTQEMVVLQDGPNRITLDKSGRLVGLESLPHESQQEVKKVLTAESIKRPNVLDELTSADVSLRAPSENEEPVKIVYPTNTIIADDKPVFEWTPAKTADGYRVEVGDSGFHQVAKSEILPPTSRTWTPSAPLKRGMVYTWVLYTVKNGDESGSVPSPPQAKFKILDDQTLKQLNELKANSQSHLALGVFYAREGMIAEAEREFQMLVRENPRSQVIRKLLRNVQSWRPS